MSKSLGKTKYTAIISRLIEERERAGISQQSLAARLGTSQSTVSKIEGLQRRLDVSEFITLLEALGISPSNVLRDFERSRRGKGDPEA
jgi:transcriptional regulator with XRE-family HTH domain